MGSGSPREWRTLEVRGPGGVWRLAAGPFGMLRLALPGTGKRRFLEECERLWAVPRGEGAARGAGRRTHDPEVLCAEVAGWIREWGPEAAAYWHACPPPLDLRGSPFRVRVWKTLRLLPPGRLITYRELAERAGAPGAARAAGTAMRKNPLPLLVPCHRVVAASGPGRFGTAGLPLKLRLLRLEGTPFPERWSERA